MKRRKKTTPTERVSEYRDYFDFTWGRNQFLMAIERVAVEVLDGLDREVMPEFRNLACGPGKDLRSLRVDREHQDKVLRPLRPHIDRWAGQSRLVDASVRSWPKWFGPSLIVWMEQVILNTLVTWAEEGPRRKWDMSDKYSVGAYFGWPAPLHLELDGWPMLRQTWKDFEKKALQEVKTKLLDYRKRCERKAEKREFVQLPQTSLPEHMDWLVLYKIKDRSQAEIAEGANRTRQAVAAGIKTAAEQVVGPWAKQWLRPKSSSRRRHQS